MPNTKPGGDSRPPLEQTGRTLVHDIATPLATMQLNLQALTTYLPRLVEVYRKHAIDADNLSLISPDHLVALTHLPHALEKDIQRLRELTQTFLINITQPVAMVSGPSLVHPQGDLYRIQRVLLVEDEEVHQQITMKQLAGKYPVDIASTGAEALRLCAAHTYDLVLLDFVLPGMDGRSLVTALRQLLPQGTVIFALSNMPIQPSEHASLGIHGFLEKPFRLKSLDVLVAGVVKARDLGEENQT
jgi:CheY-like chemotaxis protein